jgi:hypothetical protein
MKVTFFFSSRRQNRPNLAFGQGRKGEILRKFGFSIFLRGCAEALRFNALFKGARTLLLNAKRAPGRNRAYDRDVMARRRMIATS